MGTNYVEEEDMGVIPRAVYDIFNMISLKDDWSFKITISFIELYQEQLYDLLVDKQRSASIVDIRDDGKNIKVAGVVEKEVTNAVETLYCLTQGSLRRATGATAMNAHSSRSHAIFTLCIYQQKKGDPNTATTSKFHLVDLAGSERSKKTQATGERFKEGVNINKGLLALGNVISQLGEGGSMSYVGYRDSKLTRLLQDSLGGNSMTLMIACVSPADYNLDETLSTLRYADRARKIKNKPMVNQDPKISEINRLNKLIQELKLTLVDQDLRTSCPIEHRELEVKNQSLQKKIRDLTEKLNNNLIETVLMHERAELAEQAREKIQADMAKILEEFKELLGVFDKNSEKHNEYYTKLEALYLKILNIQNDQKKTSEELINCEISSENAKLFTTSDTEESEHASIDECSENPDSLDDFDEKHEEHTLLQVKRNNEVQNINKELAIKESLICQLLKNSSQIIDYSKEIQEMEQEIKRLQSEREELLQAVQNVQASNASSKLAESRRKKVQELEKKITELRRKVTEQDKIVKMKEKQDQQIKNLSNEMQLLKQTRVKLIRQMRNEYDKFTKWKESKEKEVNRLKDQNRKQINEVSRLKMWHSKQETMFKRKMAEAFAVNKRLKEALDLQKRSTMRKEKMNNNVDKIRSWLTQEVEILVSTVDAEYSLEKLMQDRASLTCMLEKFRNNDDANENKIAELMEFLDLRNAQITDLQQKIVESDQESRTYTRWQKMHTMDDARSALKILFKHIAEDRRKQCVKESAYNELLEKYELLQAQLEEYRAKEKERRMSKQLAINNTCSVKKYETEENIKLKEDLKSYQEECQQLEKIVLKKTNNSQNKLKSKVSERVTREDECPPTDDSIITDDDVEKDPDWTNTPLYNRIQKLLNATKNYSLDRRTTKRTSDGDIKCGCKTKCSTRVCTCRKNKTICSNCSCNPEICQNKDLKNLNRTLFLDYKEEDQENDESIKKPRDSIMDTLKDTLICRLCGVNFAEGKCKSIFEGSADLIHKIKEILPISISINDNGSKCICLSCYDKIILYYKFIQEVVEYSKELENTSQVKCFFDTYTSKEVTNFSQIHNDAVHTCPNCNVDLMILLVSNPQGCDYTFQISLAKVNHSEKEHLMKEKNVEVHKNIILLNNTKNNIHLKHGNKTAIEDIENISNQVSLTLPVLKQEENFNYIDTLSEKENPEIKIHKKLEGKFNESNSYDSSVHLSKISKLKEILYVSNENLLNYDYDSTDPLVKNEAESDNTCWLDSETDCKSEKDTYIIESQNIIPEKNDAQEESDVYRSCLKYVCKLCGVRYLSHLKYEFHMERHKLDKIHKYECTICDKETSSENLLWDHYFHTHKSLQRYICTECGKLFTKRSRLNGHQKNYKHFVISPRQYHCSKCPKHFVRKERLEFHEMRHNENMNEFICSTCGKDFRAENSLYEHYLFVHKGARPHICELCGKSFQLKARLKEHHRIHTGERPYQCDICGQRCRTTNALKLHRKIHFSHNRYTCNVCNKSFSKKQNMNEHLEKHWKNDKSVTLPQLFTCPICLEDFPTYRMLKYHMIEVHEVNNQDPILTKQKPWYECAECHEKFKHQMSLKAHKERAHEGRVDPIYQCDICNATYRVKQLLVNHIKSKHNGERRYKCAQCEKGFNDTKSLYNHVLLHTGKKPFVCEYCNMSFRRKDSRDHHRRKHTGEQPYQCPDCGESFSTYNNRSKHRKREHGEGDPECPECGERCSNQQEIRIHLNKHLGEKLKILQNIKTEEI
ncbi:Chromosome-associated kinesin KIF4A [Habropoda laboriosa]|uniref:Chromosome-associated kinesin KIF4A n=1 Tax=Habropoda laboriosa TaxID=597456 RepID=A0A0L7R797_9HYME|nr:Chromosome-associated kinesin KIF4A [Habropoda laboriosa]